MSQPRPIAETPWRRRIAQLALLVGAALVAARLLEAVPEDHELVFRVPSGQSLRSLRATVSDSAGEELGGLSLRFPEGRRYSVRHALRLPPGNYEIRLEVELFQADGPDPFARPKTNLVRRVSLRGGETPISL